MDDKKTMENVCIIVFISGMVAATYVACNTFEYVNDTMLNKILTAIIYPIGGGFLLLLGFIFVSSLLSGLIEEYGMKLLLIMTTIICIAIALLCARNDSKYITTRDAIENAYEDGFLDGVNDEYNDFYYTDVFQNNYKYRPAEKDN